MSKAFTKEDSSDRAPLVAPRAPLPPGVPNYVTPHGLELLRQEKRELEAARAALRGEADASARLAALGARLAELEQRIGSAVCVEPESTETVRFGSRVRVRDQTGQERTYHIVGVDEAEPAAGKIAFLSPIARALIGAEVGDRVRFERPGSAQELAVLEIG